MYRKCSTSFSKPRIYARKLERERTAKEKALKVLKKVALFAVMKIVVPLVIKAVLPIVSKVIVPIGVWVASRFED